MLVILDPAEKTDICNNFKTLGPILLCLIAIAIPFTQNQIKNSRIKKLKLLFNKVAYKKTLSLLLIAFLAFIGSAIVSLVFYWPIPTVSDEASYLLASDTFAHGRLANPTHPMWISFETFHVLQQPTYASKYPPAQGLIMAFGQILTGFPIVGIWLSMALACAAICWMLQAWLPPRWALLGGLLAVLKLALFSYWSQSFWGGAVAAIGGALVFGALRRIIKKNDFGCSIYFALGLAILANSRPYEGLAVSFPAIFYLFVWLFSKQSPSIKILFKKVILPIILLLFVTVVMMGYYNWVVTGKAWLMPYELHVKTIQNLPVFLWQKPPPPITYNYPELQELYLDELATHQSQQKLFDYLKSCSNKLIALWKFF